MAKKTDKPAPKEALSSDRIVYVKNGKGKIVQKTISKKKKK